MESRSTKFNKIKPYLPLCVMAAITTAAVILILSNENITVDMILDYTPPNKLVAAIVILMLFALKSVTVVILYNVIVVATGLLFDLPTALLINFIGTIICISIPYFVGRSSHGALTEKLLQKHKKLAKLYEVQKSRSFAFSFILRTFSLSNDLLGVFFGSLEMPYWPFLTSSLLGITPGMIAFTILGNNLDPLSPEFIVVFALDLIIILTTIAVYKKKTKTGRTISETSGKENEEE